MEKEKKVEKQIIAKEALKAINELEETVRLENIIKDNKIEFKVKDKVFRVRRPNLIEQQEISRFNRKKYIELVNDDSFLFRKQWIKKYKDKGIDIKKMEDDVRRLQGEIEQLLLRLAKSTDPSSIKKLKEEILKSRDKQFALSIEKTDLLSYSIEDQLLISVNAYTTYLILERKEKENWTKHFEDYKKFQESDNTDLLNKAFFFISHLIYRER